MPPAALQSHGMPPMQLSSQGMMVPPVMPTNPASQDSSAGPAAGAMATPGQQAPAVPVKFDISQILSVIRSNMSTAPQNAE